MERVKCMLSHAKLGKAYRGEALMMRVYIINKSSLVPLDGDIPQRAWTRKYASYRHLRVFDYFTYVHVAKDQTSKLDSVRRLGRPSGKGRRGEKTKGMVTTNEEE